MKKLITILAIAVTACNSHVNSEQQGKEIENKKKNDSTTVQLNKGSKWKADQATKKNVAEMVQVINDSSYADATKRRQLYANLQTKLDTLIKQCSMKGAEHDALHVWLEKILKDMKELNEEEGEYSEAYAALKKDMESFYVFFE